MPGPGRWWCRIQVIGHRNPGARLGIRSAGGWRPPTRTGYNSSLSTHGTGRGGQVRITDIHGRQLTVNQIALRPSIAQQTSVQFARH